ncbi:MAG: peptide deformylase [Microgenomates group bacterium]
MIRKILQSGDPTLRAKSKNVAKVDKKTLGIIRDLEDTLETQKTPEGVGLAAPQIGKNVRIFLADYNKFKRIVINPEVLEVSNKTEAKGKKKKTKNEILEGCLSLPYYYGPLKRANKVTLKYLNEKGEEIVEDFLDFNAQIVLHEIDHLDGILFVDRLLEEKKPLYKVEGEEWEEVELI